MLLYLLIHSGEKSWTTVHTAIIIINYTLFIYIYIFLKENYDTHEVQKILHKKRKYNKIKITNLYYTLYIYFLITYSDVYWRVLILPGTTTLSFLLKRYSTPIFLQPFVLHVFTQVYLLVPLVLFVANTKVHEVHLFVKR